MGQRSTGVAGRAQHRLRAHEFRHQDGPAARRHLVGRSRRPTCAAFVERPVEHVAALVARWRAPGVSRKGSGRFDATLRVLGRERRDRGDQQFYRIAERSCVVAGRPLDRIHHAGGRRTQAFESGIARSAEERQMGRSAQTHRPDGVPGRRRGLSAQRLQSAFHCQCRRRRGPPTHPRRFRQPGRTGIRCGRQERVDHGESARRRRLRTARHRNLPCRFVRRFDSSAHRSARAGPSPRRFSRRQAHRLPGLRRQTIGLSSDPTLCHGQRRLALAFAHAGARPRRRQSAMDRRQPAVAVSIRRPRRDQDRRHRSCRQDARSGGRRRRQRRLPPLFGRIVLGCPEGGCESAVRVHQGRAAGARGAGHRHLAARYRDA